MEAAPAALGSQYRTARMPLSVPGCCTVMVMSYMLSLFRKMEAPGIAVRLPGGARPLRDLNMGCESVMLIPEGSMVIAVSYLLLYLQLFWRLWPMQCDMEAAPKLQEGL